MICYADLESCAARDGAPYRCYAAGLCVHYPQGHASDYYLDFFGPDPVHDLVQKLISLAEEAALFFNDVVPAAPTPLEKAIHQRKTHCDLCKKPFGQTKPMTKTFHHNHLDGRYLASYCSKCNILCRQRRAIFVAFHCGGKEGFKNIILHYEIWLSEYLLNCFCRSI